jgi:hypothetical protein
LRADAAYSAHSWRARRDIIHDSGGKKQRQEADVRNGRHDHVSDENLRARRMSASNLGLDEPAQAACGAARRLPAGVQQHTRLIAPPARCAARLHESRRAFAAPLTGAM